MNTKLRPGILIGLVVMLSFSAVSCLRDQTLAEPKSADSVDRKLSRFAFIEEGRIAAFIISTQATIHREGEKYMPLEISVANKRAGEMSIGREKISEVISATSGTSPVSGKDFHCVPKIVLFAQR